MTYKDNNLINFLETLLKNFPQSSYFEIVRHFIMSNAVNWKVHRKSNDDHKILFVCDGRGYYSIDGVREEFSRGKIIFVGSGCQHSGQPDIKYPPSFITIRFKTIPKHNSKLGISGATTVPDTDAAEKIFQSLAEAASMEESGLSEYNLANALLYQAVALFNNELRHGDKNLVHSGVSKVIAILNNQPERLFPISFLAKNAGLNERYFAAKFKTATGLSPTSYMVKNRMRYAASLLSSGNMTVQEVADELGYSDAFVFSKQFKKVYAHSPGKAKYKD